VESVQAAVRSRTEGDLGARPVDGIRDMLLDQIARRQ
jgi:hypothetical protein